jgi:hypothetical protein
MMLTTLLHLVPRLKMSGNVPPLHLCVHRDNFHFPYVTLQSNIISFESHEYSQQTQTPFLQDPVPYNSPSVSKSSKWSHCSRFSIKTLYTFIFLTPISLCLFKHNFILPTKMNSVRGYTCLGSYKSQWVSLIYV